jgi:hypothetical protein
MNICNGYVPSVTRIRHQDSMQVLSILASSLISPWGTLPLPPRLLLIAYPAASTRLKRVRKALRRPALALSEGRFVVRRDWNFAGSGKETTHPAGWLLLTR